MVDPVRFARVNFHWGWKWSPIPRVENENGANVQQEVYPEPPEPSLFLRLGATLLVPELAPVPQWSLGGGSIVLWRDAGDLQAMPVRRSARTRQ